MADSQNKSYGYGKRPLWQWILVYVIIGVIVYGLIYYFVLAKKGGYNYSGNTNTYANPTMTPLNQPTSSQNMPTQGTQRYPSYKY